MTVNATSHVAPHQVTAKPVRDAKRTPEKNVDRNKVSNTDHQRAEKNTSKKPEPAKSPQVRDQMMCKSRPKDNKPKGGGGSGKGFVPWKGTKYGCR